MESKKVSTFAPAKQETDAPVAQLVEHLTLNQGVQSSSLCGCTKSKRDKSNNLSLFLFFISFLPYILLQQLVGRQGVFSSYPLQRCGRSCF